MREYTPSLNLIGSCNASGSSVQDFTNASATGACNDLPSLGNTHRASCDRPAPALLVYEYILTLDDEWELIWKQSMTSVSWLFLANRVTFWIYVVDVGMTSAGYNVSAPSCLAFASASYIAFRCARPCHTYGLSLVDYDLRTHQIRSAIQM